MRLIGKKIGLLSEASHDNILWEGNNTIPSMDLIKASTNKLVKRSFVIQPLQSNLFVLSNTQLIHWVESYIQNEKMELNDKFSSTRKGFTTLLLQSVDRAELNLMFRLTTVGLEGWTGYRISWARNRQNSFICKEH